jgi:hypothetical protein
VALTGIHQFTFPAFPTLIKTSFKPSYFYSRICFLETNTAVKTKNAHLWKMAPQYSRGWVSLLRWFVPRAGVGPQEVLSGLNSP